MNHLVFKIPISGLLIVLLSLTYNTTAHAKKRCKPLLTKLHNIQAMQRNSYSFKRGQSLRSQEEAARDKWWQCENMSRAKYKALYGKTKSKSKVKTKSSKVKKSSVKKKIVSSTATSTTSFNQDSAIVIKAKYQGEKLSAWLMFYQKPEQCKRPKTLNVFAYCNENKREQQAAFEQAY